MDVPLKLLVLKTQVQTRNRTHFVLLDKPSGEEGRRAMRAYAGPNMAPKAQAASKHREGMKNTKYTKELIACIASLALNAMCNTTNFCGAARRAQGGLPFYERFISHFFTYYAAMAAVVAVAAALSPMLCLLPRSICR